MKSLIIMLSCLFFFQLGIYAQIDNKTQSKVKILYFEAEDFYKKKEYSEVIKKIEEIERELRGQRLGTSQNLKIKAFIEQKNHIKAIEELVILKYLALNRDIIKESDKYSVYLEAKIEEGRNLYTRAKSTGSVSLYQSYLDKFPYGRYREEVEILMNDQKDEDAWKKAKMSANPSAYYAYLRKYPSGMHAFEAKDAITRLDKETYEKAIAEGTQSSLRNYLNLFPRGEYSDYVSSRLKDRKEYDTYMYAKRNEDIKNYESYVNQYPNGKYINEVKAAIKQLDKSAYEKAISVGTQSALNNYLDNYPRGHYRGSVNRKLTKRKEYDLYIYAKNNNYIENYEKYIEKYPNGKYAPEVTRIIEKSYYRFGNDAFAEKKYIKAKKYYEIYNSKFPHGNYTFEVNKKIKKADRKLSLKEYGMMMFNTSTLGGLNSDIGINFGYLNTNKLGFYIGFNINLGVLSKPEIHWSTIDDEGKSSSEEIWSVEDYQSRNIPSNIDRWSLSLFEYTGNESFSSFHIPVGITFPLLGQLGDRDAILFYSGAVFRKYTRYEEISVFDVNDAESDETIWVKNTDRLGWQYLPEIGFIVQFNKLSISAGAVYQSELPEQKINKEKFKERLAFRIGIGLAFPQ